MSRYETSLQIDIRKGGEACRKATIVELKGTLDSLTAAELKNTFADLVKEGHHHIVVNMSRVDYIDSCGLGSLISGYKRVREHDGTLSLVSPSDVVGRVLDLTWLNKVFNVYLKETLALEDIQRFGR